MSAHEFHVGQKVVCVDVSDGITSLREGEIYTIRLIYEGHYGSIFLALVGVHEGSDAPGFYPNRFRPLEEKPDAIEWARQICRDVGALKKAPALRTRSPA